MISQAIDLTLTTGSLVQIGKSPSVYLVVRFEEKTDMPYDGVPYRVTEMDVVEYKTLGMSGQKVRSFYFKGGSMTGSGKQIDKSDVKILGLAKFKVKTEVTYSTTREKWWV